MKNVYLLKTDKVSYYKNRYVKNTSYDLTLCIFQ